MSCPRRRLVKAVGVILIVIFLSRHLTGPARKPVNVSSGTGELGGRAVTISSVIQRNQRIAYDSMIQHRKMTETYKKEDIGRISKRKKTLERFCETHSKRSSFLGSKIPFLSEPNHFLFCPLAKCASTFWNRFVLTLNTSGRAMASPFKVSLSSRAPLPKFTMPQLGSLGNRNRFLQTSLKVIFVRDPYHRMLSAYVDKVFAPNPYFWRAWSSPPRLRRYDAGVKRAQTACHHDLKFPDVVSAVVDYLHKSDLHFVPMFRRCQACEFGYDVVGKMETFSEDLRYLSNHLNLSLTEFFASDAFRYDYVKDAIEDSINSPFGWLKNIFACMDKFEMGLRIWRKLQIRGLIDRRIFFPYSADDFKDVTTDQFIRVALKAHRESTDRKELKQQKLDAFIEAYRAVDLRVLDKVKTIFKNDFVIFDYQSHPADVFDRSQKLNVTGVFDWWKPWTA